MKVGDIIRREGRMWTVTRYDPKVTRSATLRRADGTSTQVAFNLDETDPTNCVVVSSPQTWRFLIAPRQPRLGPVESIQTFDGKAWSLLVPYEQWTMVDPSSAGGSIFFHPEVVLVPGGLVKAGHRRGEQVIRIPVKVGSVDQRRAWAEAPPKPAPPTVYDLIGDDET